MHKKSKFVPIRNTNPDAARRLAAAAGFGRSIFFVPSLFGLQYCFFQQFGRPIYRHDYLCLCVGFIAINEFLKKISTWASSIKVSDPLEKDCRLGPLVSESQYKKVKEFVRVAQEEGATLEARYQARYHAIHKDIYKWFDIDFDKFGWTLAGIPFSSRFGGKNCCYQNYCVKLCLATLFFASDCFSRGSVPRNRQWRLLCLRIMKMIVVDQIVAFKEAAAIIVGDFEVGGSLV